MPNPVKKFFRRPALRRVGKVASRQFRKLVPERGAYDVAQYRDPGEVPEWLAERIRLEDAAYKHGMHPLQNLPYRGRRHSFDFPQPAGVRKGYRSFEGYNLPQTYEDMSVGSSRVSELVSYASPAGAELQGNEVEVYQPQNYSAGPLRLQEQNYPVRPNPTRGFFRRPAVRRARKAAARQFRRLIPERDVYDIAQYRVPGEVPEWLARRMRVEDAAYKYGLHPLQNQPFRGRRHSLEYQQPEGVQRGYRSFQGYMPSGPQMVPQQRAVAPAGLDPNSTLFPSIGSSKLSELVSIDSRAERRQQRPEEKKWSFASTMGSMGMSDLSDIVASRDQFADYDEQVFEPPAMSTPQSYYSPGSTPERGATAQRELMLMMDQLEEAEVERIQKDLRQFQTSRRRLVFDVSSLSATSSPPVGLVNTSAVAGPSNARPALMPPP